MVMRISMSQTEAMLNRREFLALSAGVAVAGSAAWFSAGSAAATTVTVNGHRISGAIYDLWLPNRALAGDPTTGEYVITGGTKQKFQKAWMYTSTRGAALIRGRIRTTFTDGGGVASLGIPVATETKRADYSTYTQGCTKGRVWYSSADGGKAVPLSKTVRLRGARNFRDAASTGAGIAVTGGHLRRHVLYRANKLQRTSAMDRAILLDLGITQIIDLRRPAVAASEPDPALPGVSGRIVDLFGTTSVSDNYAQYRAFVANAYRRARIAEAITAVANADGPVLLHCTYGKDRTGWVVAMIQFALGATKATVMAEWLKSNTYLGTKTLVSGYLDAGIAEAVKRYGSVEGYLSHGLGLSDSTRSALRARLVV